MNYYFTECFVPWTFHLENRSFIVSGGINAPVKFLITPSHLCRLYCRMLNSFFLPTYNHKDFSAHVLWPGCSKCLLIVILCSVSQFPMVSLHNPLKELSEVTRRRWKSHWKNVSQISHLWFGKVLPKCHSWTGSIIYYLYVYLPAHMYTICMPEEGRKEHCTFRNWSYRSL